MKSDSIMLSDLLSGLEKYKISQEQEAKLVGEGGFGKVYVNENKKIAYKVINHKFDGRDKYQKKYQIEYDRLKELQLLASDTVCPKSYGPYTIAMKTLTEFGAIRCDLFQYFFYVNSESSLKHSRQLMAQLHVSQLIPDWIEAMEYAHNKGIHHGDIKEENILILLKSSGDIETLICDWGDGIQFTEGYRFWAPTTGLPPQMKETISKAQDVFAFYTMLLKNWRRLDNYSHLNKACLWSSFIENDAIKAIGKINLARGRPSQFGCFKQVSDILKKILSCQSLNLDIENSRDEMLDLLVSRFTYLSNLFNTNAVVEHRSSTLTYYWYLRCVQKNDLLKRSIDNINKYLNEENKQFEAKKQQIYTAIGNYQTKRQSFDAFSLFRGDKGMLRAKQLKAAVDISKDLFEVNDAVRKAQASYRLKAMPYSLSYYIASEVFNKDANPRKSPQP